MVHHVVHEHIFSGPKTDFIDLFKVWSGQGKWNDNGIRKILLMELKRGEKNKADRSLSSKMDHYFNYYKNKYITISC